MERVDRADCYEFVAKPLITILKRKLLEEHMVDKHMLHHDSMLRHHIVQMFFRLTISCPRGFLHRPAA